MRTDRENPQSLLDELVNESARRFIAEPIEMIEGREIVVGLDRATLNAVYDYELEFHEIFRKLVRETAIPTEAIFLPAVEASNPHAVSAVMSFRIVLAELKARHPELLEVEAKRFMMVEQSRRPS